VIGGLKMGKLKNLKGFLEIRHRQLPVDRFPSALAGCQLQYLLYLRYDFFGY